MVYFIVVLVCIKSTQFPYNKYKQYNVIVYEYLFIFSATGATSYQIKGSCYLSYTILQ